MKIRSKHSEKYEENFELFLKVLLAFYVKKNPSVEESDASR